MQNTGRTGKTWDLTKSPMTTNIGVNTMTVQPSCYQKGGARYSSSMPPSVAKV